MNKKHIPYLVIIAPLFLKYIFILISGGYGMLSFGDFLEDLLFVCIIYFVLNLSTNSIFRKAIVALSFFYFILEGASYMAVSSNFTSSFMYVLIESSKGEIQEFLDSYSSFKIIIFLLLMVALFFLFRKKILKQTVINKFLALAFVVATVFFLKTTGLLEHNAYRNIVRGVYGYYQLQKDFKLNTVVKPDDVKLLKNNDVLVIVLGESTARGQMQIYGFEKETTPNLNAFKDSLYIYNDVISSDVITLKSIPKLLTSLSMGQKLNAEASIINLVDVFNLADYKTFWLSNQMPIGYHDNAISKIAAPSTYIKFFNHKSENYATILDDVVLPKYNSILSEEGKKVIIIRLLGTHFDYSKRYPERFNKFHSVNNDKKSAIKNQYLNAVLYNDFIVSSILNSLRNTKGRNAFIYISDHGENVFDQGDFFGHTESNLKQNMFDVPFVVWTSKNFEYPDDFEYKPDRKFMADHLYESLAHLFGVKHKSMDFSRSIFSNSFKERKRVVVHELDYDETFINKHE